MCKKNSGLKLLKRVKPLYPKAEALGFYGLIIITDADKDCVVSIEIMGDRANVNTITSLIFDTLNQLCPDIFQA